MLPAEVVDNPEILHRWKREARLLAVLNHPNIATIHEELEESEGTSYLVLEYVEGETLRERIARGEIPVEEAVSITVQITEAMSAAHEKGVIHRDLKPANIKITPEGRVKVLDFGIAKVFGDQKREQLGTIVTQPGQVIGTPGYMSPEQALGKDIDHRTDIWSFGCVLYEMLTGRRPFPGTDTSEVLEAMLQGEPEWEALPKEIESDLRGIVRTCLAKDPGDRYQSSTELHRDISRYYNTLRAPEQKLVSTFALLRRSRLAVPTVLVLVALCTITIWLLVKYSRIQRARTILLPRAVKLAEDGDYITAFFTARQAEKYIPTDPMLLRLWSEISRDYSIVTTPPAADVFFRDYAEMQSDWNYLGRSPLEDIRFPKGPYRFRIEKEGFVIRECVAGDKGHSEPNLLTVELWEKDSPPDNMVLISSGTAQLESSEEESWKANLSGYYRPVYWIDKYEVTNEQFKEFVDKGGYQDQKNWKHTFVRDGRDISFEEAMNKFRDQTGRLGPSTWSGGTYPEGKERHPVSGISWYEAAAYAAFVGKSLPTVGHWRRAACVSQVGEFILWSNMEGEETAPVGSSPGIGITGIYDMAGNVREWCYNAEDSQENRRYILGGSWAEPTYAFDWITSLNAWDRSSINGFRSAMFETGKTKTPDGWFRPIPKSSKEDFSDPNSIKPVSEEVFRIWLEDVYSYTRNPLNARIISVDNTSPYYHKEEVEFDAAYDGERVKAYLFLPKSAQPPYQVVVYFPGTGAFDSSDRKKLTGRRYWDFIIKSGRAFMHPLYKGSHGQRKRDISGDVNRRDWRVELSKDLGRSLDYLESREDVDPNSLAFYGFSEGGWLGAILLAVEKRFKTGILAMGGLASGKTSLPSGQPVNFAPRVAIPILMVNGNQDPVFPYATHQKPLFDLLGTPEEDKKHLTYPGRHHMLGLSYVQMQKDILSWLDKYLGPVD
jgi:formylglycine-generating enzyme required for sulfatase activity/dienelactone hydrolase